MPSPLKSAVSGAEWMARGELARVDQGFGAVGQEHRDALGFADRRESYSRMDRTPAPQRTWMIPASCSSCRSMLAFQWGKMRS